MRLWDKVCQDGRGNAFPDPTIFVVDNIARAFTQNEKKQIYDFVDFPFARPPWRNTFVEWLMPKWVWMNGALQPAETNGVKAFGFWVTTIDDPYKVNEAKQAFHSTPNERFEGTGKPDIEKAEVMLLAYPVLELQGSLIYPAAEVSVWLDGSGMPVGEMVHGPALEKGGDEATCIKAMPNFLGIAMMAFSFANVKNVPTVDVTDWVQPPPKIRRRFGLPEVRRVTIEITPGEPKPLYRHADQPDAKPDSAGVAAHIVRGHFAEYTKEKPRFGRPGEFGRYWISSHARGKRELGTVEKDYVAGEMEVASA